jgi:putative transposase
MAPQMRTELVVDALEMARSGDARARCRADPPYRPRGSRYTAISFGKRLAEVGIAFPRWEEPQPPWTKRDGRELHRHLVKTELVHRRRFPDREVAKSAIFFEYLEGFYDRRRLHSALSYRSPADYEEATMEGVAVA